MFKVSLHGSLQEVSSPGICSTGYMCTGLQGQEENLLAGRAKGVVKGKWHEKLRVKKAKCI